MPDKVGLVPDKVGIMPVKGWTLHDSLKLLPVKIELVPVNEIPPLISTRPTEVQRSALLQLGSRISFLYSFFL